MEVKAGYKQTEVGVIPKEWNCESLKSLVIMMTNGFVGTATTAYSTSNDSVPYVQGYNVLPNGVEYHGMKRVSLKFHRINSKSELCKSDLLTVQTGDIGTTTMVPPELEGANCHALVITRFDQRKAFPAFYCQYFNSELGMTVFKVIETGSTMKHLNVGDMLRLFFPLPPLPEQRAIAAALSDVDALIAKLDQLIAKKRNLKQAAMQELLTGKKRLPGFNGEWQSIHVGDLGAFKGGMTPSMNNTDYWANGSFPWISSGDVKTDILETTGMCVTEVALIDKATVVVPTSAIVIVARSGILRRYLPVASISREMAINQDIKALVVFSCFDSTFVRHLLIWNGEFILATCLKSGTTVESIEFGWLKSFVVTLPKDRKEQSAIAQVLSDMDAEITAIEARRDKTRALKQGMMQELLTGRIRLL